MKRSASAHWEGNLKEGKGNLSTESGILSHTNYSFKTRFEEGEQGTNPEELLAAAHAGCFTMAVSAMLGDQDVIATQLNTEAIVTMEGLDITGIHLKIKGIVPGVTAEEFTKIVKSAEQSCVISKALSVEITSEAHLEI